MTNLRNVHHTLAIKVCISAAFIGSQIAQNSCTLFSTQLLLKRKPNSHYKGKPNQFIPRKATRFQKALTIFTKENLK